MAKQTKEVAIVDFTKFDVAQLPELKGKKDEIASVIKANPIVEIVDNSTYELAKKSRTAVKTLRTSLEKEKKEVNDRIKKNVLEVVANEYDSLISGVKQSELARQEKVDVWETKKEDERLEKLRLEEERIANIKKIISEFKENQSKFIETCVFQSIEATKEVFGKEISEFDRDNLAEYEVLFDDTIAYLHNLLEYKIKTLTEQEQIRIDNLLIEEKNSETKRIQEWQRTWNANIDTLSFDDIVDVKSVLVKSKLANLKHYSASYEEIFVSTEKRLHSQIEFVSKAEEQRIAQEKFLADKKAFETQQLNARTFSRCKQLLDLGFVLSQDQTVYQKGLHCLNLEDIRLASDDLWLRELEDAKNVKDFSEIATTEASEIEVVEEVLIAENYHEDDVHEVATKGLSTRLKAGNLPSVTIEETWSTIWLRLEEELANSEISVSRAFHWLSEKYNVPTPKN